ncbi:MAG: hypothetical protein A3F13_05150 [Gammaproteobacteria bacterium RIFCSPHIGHO2_12_FULL_40_19]|nr:MAG: hypothetical protein A3F13_05150 [Gammaproteobacteria bacterium RIFCSPHIGHO2_12_FULL_40_19]
MIAGAHYQPNKIINTTLNASRPIAACLKNVQYLRTTTNTLRCAMSRSIAEFATSLNEVPPFEALVTETFEEKINAIKVALTYLMRLDQSVDFNKKAKSVLVFLSMNTDTPEQYPQLKLAAALLTLSNIGKAHKPLGALFDFFTTPGKIVLDATSMKAIAGLSKNENTFVRRV